MKTPLIDIEADIIRKSVREHYGKIAGSEPGCGCAPTCCAPKPGAPSPTQSAAEISQGLGYSTEQTHAVPEGANLGLGCGNPLAIASLHTGQTVLDLGSGGGFDCFLAARVVGDTGHVIGVDMTPEMIRKAKVNAAKGDYRNVEFRLGEIEQLPVADSSVDVIISNCVINLSPDKSQVFREAFRVLKPGGKLAVSDVVAVAPLPAHLREDRALHAGCVAGVSSTGELEAALLAAGFVKIRIQLKTETRQATDSGASGRGIEDLVVSATIEAAKP